MAHGFLRKASGLFVLAVSLVLAAPAGAVTIEAASVGGLMQQPTSHYYHAVYGMTAGASNDTQSLRIRGSYIERPEFKNAGYADKDYGWFALVGTKLTKWTGHGLYGFIGAGRMAGYVKVDRSANAEAGKDKSTYIVSGPTAAVEYGVRLGKFDLSVGHQTFIGLVDQTQLKAYVAWPYNFYSVNIGVAW